MYKIREFSAMTGLSQSGVRFYEKQKLLKVHRDESGYRSFLPEDAFRLNSFRVLLGYGFSVNEAVAMLDVKQNSEGFINELAQKKEALQYEADLLKYRLIKINSALNFLNHEQGSEFSMVDMPDQIFIRASNDRDFSVSIENKQALAEYYRLLSITSCARIIKKSDFDNQNPTVKPSYMLTLHENESHRLSKETLEKTEKLILGKCIRYQRKATREESVKKESFNDLMTYLDSHGYQLRNDICLYPAFLNLDGEDSDIETLFVPVK